MKTKVLVDIDVVAVPKIYTNDRDYPLAKPFIDRSEAGEFEINTPYTLLDTVSKWKDETERKKVLDFYHLCSTEILSVEKVADKFNKSGIIRERLVPTFVKHDIKEEDATLVLICSVFQLKLVTLNRKHLRNKKEEINKILKEDGLSGIEILLPSEL